MDDNKRPKPRILVLGSAPHTRLIRAHTWDDLSPDLNVADYDVVVLNFTPFVNQKFARSIDLDTLPSWEQFARLIFSQGSEVIAIGNPGLKIGDNPYMETTWWLPIIPVVVHESGEQTRDTEAEFAYYLSLVRRWFFFATNEFSETGISGRLYGQVVHTEADGIQLAMIPISQTRFGKAIAFELRFRAVKRLSGSSLQAAILADTKRTSPLIDSGRVIWLPPPTELSAYDAVNLILSERYGISIEHTPPSWVEAYKLPAEIAIEKAIAQCENEMQRLSDELAAARDRLQDATRFNKLLYEQGEDALEPVVRDTLRELGAQVERPQVKGREDGRLIDPAGRNGMLEIKGRTGSLRLSDVRQLDQWVRDAVAEEEWKGKGILIANMFCGDPPLQREQPFPDNCIRAAKRFGICLVTTSQLFLALYEHQRDRLDVTGLWDTAFATNGVCPLPELGEPEQSTLSDG